VEDNTFIRWGCTTNLPKQIGGHNTVINNAKAIHLVADKLEFRRVLEEAELCPRTWFKWNDGPHEDKGVSVIVRTRYHHQGRGMWLVHNYRDLQKCCVALGEGNYYINDYINKVAEYRVFVVQGRVVCVAQKTPGNPEAVAWNVAKGGRFDNVRWDAWPLKAVRKSVEAFNLSGLDFGGVDVMVDAEGECYILEINSAPSLTSPYRQECFAKAFDYIVENGKDRIPLTKKRGGYTKFIHPAICDHAILKKFDEVYMEQFDKEND
jgi:glutathione synthase/RimK-type ligase-like ATP-grasp enzyme